MNLLAGSEFVRIVKTMNLVELMLKVNTVRPSNPGNPRLMQLCAGTCVNTYPGGSLAIHLQIKSYQSVFEQKVMELLHVTRQVSGLDIHLQFRCY